MTVSEADFPAIEDRMRAHVKAAERFEREDIPVADARARFPAARQDYKVELIDDLVSAPTRPRGGEGFETRLAVHQRPLHRPLPRPARAHAPKTVGAFKLQSVAGAYWRGDSTRTMLTRIYGTAFFTKAELEEHLERLEQARARDHRKLGRELDLFQFSELSPGAPLWKPAGMVVWNALTELGARRTALAATRRSKRRSCTTSSSSSSPATGTISGEHVLHRGRERPMGLKPMNCPAHIQIYKDARHSYRDLPIRYSEQGLVHRHEPSGALHGLLRVRPITQDDAHIFCTEEQVQEEVVQCLRFGFHIYELFGFEPRLELSTRPEKRIGGDAMWDRAEAALAGALEAEGLAYELNPGDGAFYGPKIDLHMTDSIGRSWQLGTVQLDYSMPERFELAYTGADNAEHRPVMIHRALLGSFERFIGILIEHYAGELPLWLAPVQAIVLPRLRPLQRVRRRRAGAPARAGPARRARRPQRVDRAQGARRRAAPHPAHARGGRARGSARARCRCASTGLETRAAHRWRSSRSGWRHTRDGARPRPRRRSCARTHSPVHPQGRDPCHRRAVRCSRGAESVVVRSHLARRRHPVILGRLEEFPHPIFSVPRHRIGLTRRQDS